VPRHIISDVLHWLPVPQRILFKIAISAFDCVHEHCPAYFSNVCIQVTGISGLANLRSAERHDMLVPLTRTQLGRRSFDVVAPTVWNALPSQLRSSSISRGQFRAGLKTHLFTQTPRRTSVEEHIILHYMPSKQPSSRPLRTSSLPSSTSSCVISSSTMN